MLNREPRDVWQEAFEEALDAGENEFAASRAGDEAVADYLARGADDAYDRYRDSVYADEVRSADYYEQFLGGE